MPSQALAKEEALRALKASWRVIDWRLRCEDKKLRAQAALTEALIILRAGKGLRGEEAPQIDLGGLQKKNFMGCPRAPLALKGRLKQASGKKLHFQPLVMKSEPRVQRHTWTF